MRKITSLVTTFLVASAVLVGGGAAQATTSTLEECVPVAGVAAWTETIPAVTKQVPHNAEYKTVEITPAVEYKAAVYETEYEFAHKNDPYKTKWSTNPNWNAESNDNSKGWSATGNTRQGKLISAEVLAKPAVTEQQLVKEAWTETVVVTPEQKIDHPEVKAVTCDDEVPPVVTPQTKTLKWQLPATGTWPQTVFNAATVPCGTTVRVQVDTYPYTTESDKARTDALDDDGFLREGEDYGWAKSWYFENYTAPACGPIEVPANPKADITATCGAADIVLTNTQKEGEANKTASFVVEVDGKFYDTYAVFPNESETVSLTFPEDSGDHKVEVYQAGTSEWKLIASEDVKSDCKVPPTTPPTEEPTVVTPPVVETPTATPSPVVANNVSDDMLAQTGFEGSQLWVILSAVAGAMGLGATFMIRSAVRARRIEK